MRARSILDQVNATIKKREEAAEKISGSDELLNEVMQYIFKHDEAFSLKALMVIEVLGRKNFSCLYPYISELVISGKGYTDSSSRRCLAKIYNFSINKHLDPNSNFQFNTSIRSTIIDLSFLWLISEEQTAVKVFSMQNIYDLKNEREWISEELKGILDKDIVSSSAGYKSRAIKILRKLR
ncbi:hypothetical protein G3I01_15180 [Gramella sp. MT6]|uniref:hypothetical protein n=1 Tax=Gramella sp. MT6 TaxID=2705471 RepID=UPI001C605FE7|nr:hypothetical protein [Gramella sp. MT6]QYA26778.1 hypothetical protein G3I01_15180 [Gramella sp. MT6]